MKKLQWFERQFTFGLPPGMLPFYVDRLEGTMVRMEAKVKNVSDELLSVKVDGKWSAKQNIGHLAEVDEISLKRIDEMIDGISPLSSAVFETKQDYNAQSINDVLNYFRENRVKTLNRYWDVKSDQLLTSSLHPRLKVLLTPVDLVWFDAEHDDHHLVRISEIINTCQHGE